MKNKESKTYAYFSRLVGSVGHHLLILKVAGEEEVVSMSNYRKVFNKASRRIECKGTHEADWHSCDLFKG